MADEGKAPIKVETVGGTGEAADFVLAFLTATNPYKDGFFRIEIARLHKKGFLIDSVRKLFMDMLSELAIRFMEEEGIIASNPQIEPGPFTEAG